MGKGLGSRHEMFATLVITARNFRDPNNPNRTGLTLGIPDIAQIRALLESEVGHTTPCVRIDLKFRLSECLPNSHVD